ncbi:fructose PTS transporter subunit IIB [Enterococcus hulanensis]|uniref:Fructose PTS transporter subunit IIB n=1 Tax=Enterococcus hulanensis TaxID=2559929 RepID=A0ABU3F066_9ENTE|nr:fructose PTS transporter subunit IIB [Enterococcus hulanensis]MDT2599566.1 fructose PTS transporter subunit IIB [Enterococcus hulanensis]MDT2609578.1 fructose PTS transporter subunit IIB [Enterococcus hulanensis]MDT2616155.1 fructose PTS transporter subunit IIB [Enterococcus hulanensis]MDT2627805.1 fructose PTS transporter subunit IIB [Enterococcus hulanensis]MDT2654910.1 fructose PTS transporter subunit IIB [Enterococcus hulanensis]
MKIVGVSACPTGVAHTYMAQEALEKEGKKRGHEIKIETQGSIGIENEVTEEEAEEADVVILAVSVFIENEERFEDKLVLNADVNDAISYPAKVLDAVEKLVNG